MNLGICPFSKYEAVSSSYESGVDFSACLSNRMAASFADRPSDSGTLSVPHEWKNIADNGKRLYISAGLMRE